MIWMIVFYRFLGVIADIALLIYAALYFGVILAIPVTLTLPGIAGLILTIGVAADANVVVFERIKEEVRAGRSVRTAISTGYKKGFSTIIDANAVTLITAAGAVRRQPVERPRVRLPARHRRDRVDVHRRRARRGRCSGSWAASSGSTTPPSWAPPRSRCAGRSTSSAAPRCGSPSPGAVILVGLGSLAIQGLNRGLDFTGGTRLSFAITSPGGATVDEIRAVAKTIDRELATRSSAAPARRSATDHYGGFQVESKEVRGRGRSSNFRFALLKKFGENAVPADKFSQTTVSGSFGREILRPRSSPSSSRCS